MLKLQEEKEKVKISSFSRRERDILNAVPLLSEEKEKSRVLNFRDEKETFSFSDIKYPPKTSFHNSFPPHHTSNPENAYFSLKYEAFLTGRERETKNRLS